MTPTVLELAARLAAGETTASELCEQALARAATPELAHVLITTTAERARDEARASDRRHAAGTALGPLDGIPVVWKDLVDLAGTVTTAGSQTRRDAAPAVRDAPIAAQLAAAGTVCVGKVNLTEIAFSGIGLNPHYGTPANPRDPARVPGGSSSGSAAAVAAGLVPVAIGTDTAGSIRIPSAFCGVTGLKTSAARISRDGVVPLAPSLDTVGPIAGDVAGCALVDAALRGAVARVPEPAPPATVTLAVADVDADPDVAAAVAEAIERLAAAGMTVERRAIPSLDAVAALFTEHGALGPAEAGRVHAELLEEPAASLLDRRVRDRLQLGQATSDASLAALLGARDALVEAFAAELDGALLAVPTAPHVAPVAAELEADRELFHSVNVRTLSLTGRLSYLDAPGISLPAGRGAHAMPVGLLLCAPSGDDDRLLSAALTAESILAG